MSTINYYKECLKILDNLHKSHPSFSLGRHLSTALSDYGDVWGMPNKEFLYALRKYEAEMELNNGKASSHEKFVDKIVKDAMDIDNLLNEEDQEDNY